MMKVLFLLMNVKYWLLSCVFLGWSLLPR